MTLTPSVRLYRVWFRVRPSTRHPLFFEIQHGILVIYIFASSLDHAHQDALTILRVLPYEIVGETNRVDEEPHEGAEDWEKGTRAQAGGTGLAIRLLHVPTGADEPDENFQWPL